MTVSQQKGQVSNSCSVHNTEHLRSYKLVLKSKEFLDPRIYTGIPNKSVPMPVNKYLSNRIDEPASKSKSKQPKTAKDSF